MWERSVHEPTELARGGFAQRLGWYLEALGGASCSGPAVWWRLQFPYRASQVRHRGGATNVPTPGFVTRDDDGGDHGAAEPWVDCPRRKHLHAADPLGPVVAHGATEAPGFRSGLLRPGEDRLFRRASLQLDPFGENFFLGGLTLPNPNPSREELARFVELAVRLSGKRLPAGPLITAQRQASDEEGERRIWDVAFVHEGVRVTPAGCQLSAPLRQAFPAALSCRVPPGNSPLTFDRFEISDSEAIQRSVAVSQVHALIADVQRLYVVREAVRVGAGAEGRFYVVHFDGRREVLTVLDALGQVVASGPNERSFAFTGYEPDYLDGLKKVQTQIEVGDGQTALDTAFLDPTKVSCITPDGGQLYPTGFAICRNDMLVEPSLIPLQPQVAPRSDDDYTNPANAPVPVNVQPDPLGPQILLLNQVHGVGPIHGALNDVTVRPALSVPPAPWDAYLRTNVISEQPIGPSHHSELQAFHNAGKLQKFYATFDSRFEVLFQDRFRTSITVHWRPVFTGDDPVATTDFNNAKAGRFTIKFADARPVVNSQPASYALDATSDRSLFAHEYHHHIQESLAKDEGWNLVPNPAGDPDELFPGECPASQPCKRRFVVLEGLADGFAALEVRRGLLAPIFASTEPLGSLLSGCDNKSAYGSGNIGAGARSLCNKRAFGFWKEVEPTGGDTNACTWPSFEAGQFHTDRRLVVGGAMFGYERRFFDAGIGSAIPARHLLEAERTLQFTADGEVKYFGGLLSYLRSSPFAGLRRYEYTARSAFIEKGIFPPGVHFLAALATGDVDARPLVRCNTSECSAASALNLAALTLTMSGPLDWSSTAQAPEFDVFAVPGTRYTVATGPGNPNQVWLELSDNAAFSSAAGGVTTRDAQTFNPTARLNCSPSGFFRATPSAASWGSVAGSALLGGDRVYYRVRQCLASATGPDDPTACVVSTTATTPAYVRVHFEAGGCPAQCGVVGAESEREAWPWLALLPLAAGFVRRLVRRRGVQ